MNIFQRVNHSIQRYRWYDISLIKLSTAAFVLMVAKLWPPVLALDWHWYLAISIVIALPVMRKFCASKSVPHATTY